jgi:NADH-quinone oxidoreductase subunit E
MQKVKNYDKVCEIINNFNGDKSKLIPILQKIQEIYKYLPEDSMELVAEMLDIPPGRVFGVATFYSHFTLTPKGKYIIKICDGTACHVKKSMSIHEAIEKKLDLSESKSTTDDKLFTLETVSCLGACGLAPVVVINETVYGQMTPDKINEVIDSIIEKEGISK